MRTFPQCNSNAPWAGSVPGTAGLWGRGTVYGPSRRASATPPTAAPDMDVCWGDYGRKPALTRLALRDLNSPAPDSHADLR